MKNYVQKTINLHDNDIHFSASQSIILKSSSICEKISSSSLRSSVSRRSRSRYSNLSSLSSISWFENS